MASCPHAVPQLGLVRMREAVESGRHIFVTVATRPRRGILDRGKFVKQQHKFFVAYNRARQFNQEFVAKRFSKSGQQSRSCETRCYCHWTTSGGMNGPDLLLFISKSNSSKTGSSGFGFCTGLALSRFRGVNPKRSRHAIIVFSHSCASARYGFFFSRSINSPDLSLTV